MLSNFWDYWERLHNPDFKPLEFEGILPELTPAQVVYTYANEADMLNVVLFGKTVKQWKDENPLGLDDVRKITGG